jgi:multidrug efflux pump subunit AcrA (membrane-fusion protein)
MTATLQIEALGSNTILHGKVVSVATLAQQDDWGRGGVKEYETIVSIDDLPQDAGLRPGMTAEVKITVKTVPDALTVPVSAVTESGGKHIAYVVVAGGAIDRREVTIGEGNDQLVQVTGGLTEVERVAQDSRRRAAAE